MKIFEKIKKHKILTAVVLIILTGGGYYYAHSKNADAAPVKYVIGQVQKGALITSVSGTGQVSATNQVDITPTAAADVVSVKAKAGDAVKTGDVLLQLDTKDLQNSLNDAKDSLASAVANYNQKMAGPTKEDEVIAKNAIETAKLAYNTSLTSRQNAEDSADQSLAKAQRDLADAQRNYDNAVATGDINTNTKSTDVINAYTTAKNTVNTVYANMRSALVLVDGILGINNYNSTVNSYKNLLGIRNPQTLSDANDSYEVARSALIKFENDYKTTQWTDDQTDSLLNEAQDAMEKSRKMDQDTYQVLLNSVISTDLTDTTLTSLKTSVSSQETSANSSVSSIQSAKQGIVTAKLSENSNDISSSGSVATAQSALETAKNNLTQVQSDNKKNLDSANSDVQNKKLAWDNAQAQYDLKVAKPRPVDIATYKIQISQAQNTYNDALQKFNDATIKSPIDGTVAKVYKQPGEKAAAADILVTVVTNKQMAEVTLNEVDVAKVKAGQKATLTFSAIDGLSITGQVVEVDNIGTVTQGVVDYSVKIAFDTQDSRIKPQMSVSAAITTSEKLDALTVPNSAVKTDSTGLSFVETLPGATEATNSSGITSKAAPQEKYIQVGLSNDTDTEVTGGLNEGDLIITRTISGTATPAASQNNALRALGGGGGMGGNVRVIGK